MKTTKLLCYLFLACFLYSSSSSAESEKVSLRDLMKNVDRYYDSYIETEGFIIQYVPETQTSTSYYLLKGYYGNILKVNTAEAKPEINQKYRVWGILYKDTRNNINYPFLSEKSKIILSAEPPGPHVEPPHNLPLWMYMVISAAGLIILGGGLFVFVRNKNGNKQQPSEWQPEPLTTDYSKIPTIEAPPPYQSNIPDNSFKTVKINTAPNKTMRIIPGHLEIMIGEDKGKSFLIQGYPSKEGSIISIGREVVTGERSHSHIQIDSRYQTVSRKQAELIYRDKKLFLRNLSETNLTLVDGHELSLGEMVELNPDSIIKMGEIEFQYKL